MRPAITCLGSLLLLLTISPALEAQGQPVGDIPKSDEKAVQAIDRYLESIGGKETLEAIKTKILKFENRKYAPTGVTKMQMARFQKEGYKLREEWEMPSMGLKPEGEPLRFLQVYDGEKAYVRAMGYVSALTGKTLTVFVWDKFLDDSFMHWEADGYTARYLGESQIAEKNAAIVELVPFAGGQRIRSYFALDDGLLLKKEWTEASGPAGLLKKEVFFAEYAAIPFMDDRNKRIKMPLNHKIYEDGELSLEKVFNEIKFNSPIDDAVFKRPEGPDFSELQKKREEERAAGATSKPATQPKKKPTTQPKKTPIKKPGTPPKKGG